MSPTSYQTAPPRSTIWFLYTQR